MSDEILSRLWIAEAISKQYFQLIEYKDFKNIEDFTKGGSAQIRCADWKDEKIILKRLINYNIQKLVQEVNYYSLIYFFSFFINYFKEILFYIHA
jgi:hypothetical protein